MGEGGGKGKFKDGRVTHNRGGGVVVGLLMGVFTPLEDMICVKNINFRD